MYTSHSTRQKWIVAQTIKIASSRFSTASLAVENLPLLDNRIFPMMLAQFGATAATIEGIWAHEAAALWTRDGSATTG